MLAHAINRTKRAVPCISVRNGFEKSPCSSRIGTTVLTSTVAETVRAYIPKPLPPHPPLDLARLLAPIERANQALGRLDGMTEGMAEVQHCAHVAFALVPADNLGLDFAGSADCVGQRLRLAARGPAAPRGGIPGDLYVTVRVKPDARFVRRGQDLVHVRRVAFTQATLGAEVEVETLEGTETLHIPAGTQPGASFRIKGAGVPNLRGRGRGDLVVQVDIEVPTKLSDEEADLLRQFAEQRGEELAPEDRGVLSRLKSAFQ